MTELERLDLIEEYVKRYERKEAAILQNRENQDFLKSLIHDDIYVSEIYDMKGKLTQEMKLVGIGMLAVFLLILIISRSLIVSLVFALFTLIGGTVFFIALNRYRLDKMMEKQSEYNEGVIEEIERLRELEPEIVKHKDDFIKGFDEHVGFISFSDVKYIPDLRQSIEEGEAETCEEAAAILEQKLLLQQFNTIMENQEMERAYVKSEQERKERTANPLESIKPSPKKSLKEKIFGKRLKKKQKNYFEEQDETYDPKAFAGLKKK